MNVADELDDRQHLGAAAAADARGPRRHIAVEQHLALLCAPASANAAREVHVHHGNNI